MDWFKFISVLIGPQGTSIVRRSPRVSRIPYKSGQLFSPFFLKKFAPAGCCTYMILRGDYGEAPSRLPYLWAVFWKICRSCFGRISSPPRPPRWGEDPSITTYASYVAGRGPRRGGSSVEDTTVGRIPSVENSGRPPGQPLAYRSLLRELVLFLGTYGASRGSGTTYVILDWRT